MAKRDVGITLIAIGKTAKAAVLLTAGVLMVAGDASQSITHAANVLGVDPHNHYLHDAIAEVTKVDRTRLKELGVGSFVYAVLFLVEGGGLWFRKRWGEWLTLIITASFVPLEIYELAHHMSVAKLLLLVVNLVAVAYLAVRRLRHRSVSGENIHQGHPGT